MSQALQYQRIMEGPAIAVRNDRASLRVDGRDRVGWLHNLATNHVKTIDPGHGIYAYFLNVQGRIQFDANILIQADHILLDLDRSFLERAKSHLAKYVIVEDVTLSDQSSTEVRWALVGRSSSDLFSRLGISHARNLPLLASVEHDWNGLVIRIVRTDFCGPISWELMIPVRDAIRLQEWLGGEGFLECTPEAIHVCRIEAGIPWPGTEITDEYLPAETGQLHRAVCFNKGCYLGQEVVERMRSRSVVARQLVGLKMEGDLLPSQGAPLLVEQDKTVGCLTSCCHSPALGQTIGLAYLRSAECQSGRTVQISWVSGPTRAEVTELPFVRPMPISVD